MMHTASLGDWILKRPGFFLFLPLVNGGKKSFLIHLCFPSNIEMPEKILPMKGENDALDNLESSRFSVCPLLSVANTLDWSRFFQRNSWFVFEFSWKYTNKTVRKYNCDYLLVKFLKFWAFITRPKSNKHIQICQKSRVGCRGKGGLELLIADRSGFRCRCIYWQQR